MKQLIFLSLILFAACEGVDKKAPFVGQSRTFQFANPTATDKANLTAICQAIAYKSSILLGQMNNSAFDFDFSQKGCKDSELGASAIISTTLRSQGSQYYFDAGTRSFPFSEVETTSSGNLSVLCNSIANGTNPMYLDQSGLTAIWYSTSNNSYCQSSRGSTQCLFIEIGTSNGGSQYVINSREIIKFSVSGERRGFFLERNLFSTGGCVSGEVQKKASLR